MPGTMSRADLVVDLKGMLQDAATKFTGAGGSDFWRHLDVAAFSLGQFRRRTLVGSVYLVADQSNYPAPADLVAPKYPLWGRSEQRSRKPWIRDYPARLPHLSLVEAAGSRELMIDPAPSAVDIASLGSQYKFYYFAAHTIGQLATDTTVTQADRPLLLIRAAAQALQELAANGVTKPVSLGKSGVGGMPKNGTPGALAEQLVDLFERMAA